LKDVLTDREKKEIAALEKELERLYGEQERLNREYQEKLKHLIELASRVVDRLSALRMKPLQEYFEEHPDDPFLHGG